MIKVDYQGEMLSLTALARRCGMNHKTIHTRYRTGKRGDELWAEPKASMSRTKPDTESHPNPDLIQISEDSRTIRLREKAKEDQKRDRQRERAEQLEAIRREHKRLFNMPLISRTLLSSRDRSNIKNSVKGCGQLRWADNGVFGSRRGAIT